PRATPRLRGSTPMAILRGLRDGRWKPPIQFPRRPRLTRVRFPAALFVAAVLAFAHPFPAQAAPEVHQPNLVISGIPASAQGGAFNDVVDAYNQLLESHGIIGLDHIASGWHFDGEVRYFMRPNLAIAMGVGSITVSQSGEVFPRLQQDITYEAKMSGVPVHL